MLLNFDDPHGQYCPSALTDCSTGWALGSLKQEKNAAKSDKRKFLKYNQVVIR